MDVGSWLRNLGLGQYEPAFVANAIDSDVLAELTEVDFEKMGIPLGDRKRLMRAISAMVAGSPRVVTKADHWGRCAKRARCRTPSPHRDDLRSGRFDSPNGPT